MNYIFKTWTDLMDYNGFLSTSFLLYSDWVPAVCQRSAVLLWPQLWSPTPPIWESWIWVTTSCRIQEWSCCVIFWRVHTVDWRLWGQTPCFTSVLRLIWCESCGDTKLQTEGWCLWGKILFRFKHSNVVFKYLNTI